MQEEYVRARPHLKQLAIQMQSLLEFADEMYQRGRCDGEAVEYAAFERAVAEKAAAVERAVHEVALSGLDIDAPLVRVWGKAYRRVLRQRRTFATLAGPAQVTRTLYREVGRRNGPVLDPVAVRAGAVQRSWLPQTARAMAHLLAQGTSREAARIGAEVGRLRYSRSSFERVGHAVGRQYTQRRRVVEPALIKALTIPDEATSISVSVDRVTVPMEEAVRPPVEGELPPDQAAWLSKPQGEPETQWERLQRATRREQELSKRIHAETKIERNYRQAYCATLTFHDCKGHALHTIRYGRMPAQEHSVERYRRRNAHELMQRLQQDVLAVLAMRPKLKVVLLADGAAELWTLFEQYLNDRVLDTRTVRLIDAWHALEYVGAAARLVTARGKGWPGLYRHWKAKLLQYDGGAATLVRALRATGLEQARDADGHRAVGDAIRYIESRLGRMNYADARSQGLPIGSGAVEATCKSLVSLRMKRAGSRWKSKTGDDVLSLRALELSDRWDDALPRVLKPLRKRVQRLDRPASGAA